MFLQRHSGAGSNRAIQKRRASEELLRPYARCTGEEALQLQGSGPRGLSAAAAAERLEECGPNRIRSEARHGLLYRLGQAFINPFNLVLLLVAAITFVTDVLLSQSGDVTTVVIVLALVGLSGLVSFVQGERSGKAAAALQSMISNQVDVVREGETRSIPIDQVVPGDVVRLSAGDIIPGDVRFLAAKDAFLSQAALTGESAPVEKFAQLPGGEKGALTDLGALGFMGSNMISGSATALVVATGNDTYFGSMAQSLSGDRAKNSFERGVDGVSRLLIRFMLAMVPVIFLVNGFTKGDWGSALLFAVTIAVGLTPEMLPMIMTSTLAKGAVAMSKHQTIVKTLSSIQTFGEMDVLCTDKTGTLTEDRIVLEKYMDVRGGDDLRILRHAYLNSAFQTGLKNLIDLAIIGRAGENGLPPLLEGYTRVDEIPFDFSRRRMSVVLSDGSGKRQLITKGAVEEVLSICAFAELDGAILPLTPDVRQAALAVCAAHSAEGLRMIAVAQKNELPAAENFSVADEREMVLLGFIGFLDPPKESSKAAVAALRQHGVRTVVLTGDSEGVAVKVCGKVGIDTGHRLTGAQVEEMDDSALGEAVQRCQLFSKLSPLQKSRVVEAFQRAGHTVGYMGDGINDAPAMRQADVGISVDSAVDIAKETADIILLKKDLMVLEEGVLEGRRTFGNIVKYIKMAASGNFGNMISVMVASLFLPFLPLLPVHILIQNLLCDFAQLGIPFDRVDASYLRSPRRWETGTIQRFMLIMGPLSSLFDIALYLLLWFWLGANTAGLAPLFQCGCFVFGTLSQIAVVHMIRTARIPFVQSRAALPLALSTGVVGAVALFLGFGPAAAAIDLRPLPLAFLPCLALLLGGYCVASQLVKRLYVRRWGEWL
ncbi:MULTISPECIES: magnesium-translocating P-type ATPase [Eubacteriales]|uniref:Magnesium-transporting ATPase, P-type 1 n=1 Tax=Bittarella massiliensis (ex Durand et al. 2017) TaxID=1720313 RepID=A0AAQ1MB33_9FIRM|nr:MULTISPECIES: magnesium-translocating P-type ATPase [Eubacteriales]ERI98698.1 magnesium-importing ATPase [Clostridium sp. ATCC 29733]MZL68558.1 magnesium-translocating P-type ATPase [Bittarella massiliensis (ex Durand et al. 2017)]MZL79387.1 magnesium-translocating P-type ATPase [Bittarella massiliensis (ex Durand et al. 2017)]SHF65106.1 Mg2+-importing ATPase [Bittarella massiliensis (ex Durand et al. 2017)]